MAEMCNMLGIKKTWTTTFHPQSDCMVEGINKMLEEKLSKLSMIINTKGTTIYPSWWWLCIRPPTSPPNVLLLHILYITWEETQMGCAEPTPARSYNERLLKTLEEVHNFAQNNLRLSSDHDEEPLWCQSRWQNLPNRWCYVVIQSEEEVRSHPKAHASLGRTHSCTHTHTHTCNSSDYSPYVNQSKVFILVFSDESIEVSVNNRLS